MEDLEELIDRYRSKIRHSLQVSQWFESISFDNKLSVLKEFIAYIVSNIFSENKSLRLITMPPKKIAAKGAKGKVKAVEKEEKKQQKVVKQSTKGKLMSLFCLSKNEAYIVRLYM